MDDNEERDDTFKELIRIVKNIDVNSGQSLQEIKILKENVTSLESKMKKNIPEFAKPDDVIPTDERIVELRKCDSVQDIIETFSELVFEKETDSILCELCFVEKGEQGSSTPGQFIIDFEEGTYFKKKRKSKGNPYTI